jgi:hypothetical protein
MEHERVLATMDKEIDAARRTLDQLTTARQSYAAAHGLTGRKAVTSTNGEPLAGSLSSVLLRVMADGAWWHVDDVVAAVQKERTTSKGTVNTALARGSQEGGPFERGQRRGTYQVRPEVIARWAAAAPTPTAA